MRGTVSVPALLGVLGVLLLHSSNAVAGNMELTRVVVKGNGVSDTASTVNIKVKGRLEVGLPLDPDAPLVFGFGTLTDSRTASLLLLKNGGRVQKGTFLLTDKAKIVVKVSTVTGLFTVMARKVKVGPLGHEFPFQIRFGSAGVSALLDLPAIGKKARHDLGDDMLARIEGRVIGAGSSRGRPALAPMANSGFVDNDAEEPALDVALVDIDGKTDEDGRFTAIIRFRDPREVEVLNMGGVVGAVRPQGAAADSTRAGRGAPVFGANGTLRILSFLQRSVAQVATIGPSGGTVEATKAEGARSGKLIFLPGAVSSSVSGICFTPYTLPAEIPAPLPSAYVPVAGAEIRAPTPVALTTSSVTVELDRPEWVRRSVLTGKTLVLLQYRSGAWEVTTGSGKYDPATDRIVPHGSAPATLQGLEPVVYAISRPGQGRLRGRLRRSGTTAVRDMAVFTSAGVTVSDAEGEFDLPLSAVDSSDLQALQVIDADLNAAVALDPGQAGSDLQVDLTPVPTFTWKGTTIAGRVFRPDGFTPVPGASVTVRLSPALTGLSYDDGGTPTEASDDTFLLPDLSSIGVESVQWTLLIPSVPAAEREFLSTLYNGRIVSPFAVLQEAGDAGKTVPGGAYTLRARVSIPAVGNLDTYGFFRILYDGPTVDITEVQVPTPFEGVQSVAGTSKVDGTFSIAYRAPEGLPIELQAVAPDGAATSFVTFLASDQSALANLIVGGSGSLPEGFAFQSGQVICLEDGAEMVVVPEGEFTQGGGSTSDADPAHPVYLRGYLIDRLEVTVGRYKAFCTANQAFTLPTQPAGSTDAHPVVNVRWDEAKAYAEWAGKRLPTEAEWERAARGTDGRAYPWGDVDDAARRNLSGTALEEAPSHDAGVADGSSPVGCLNMAGNAAEWCSDWYGAGFYGTTPYFAPSGEDSGTTRVVRGGAWNGAAGDLVTGARGSEIPTQRLPGVGFRCAASLR